MRAYIHGFRGLPWNSECRVARDGFKKLGVETVLFTTNEELDTRNIEDVVVGGTIIVWHALNQRGISFCHNDYPPELAGFLGRKILKMQLSEVRNEKLPVFIKPVEEKTAPGITVRAWSDLEEYERFDPDTEIYRSDVVHFASEWRCFLLYGKIVGLHFYYGDSDIECDGNVLDAAVRAFPGAPAGCALDFGVTDQGETLLIEMNDGFSLGTYGLEPTLYARLLSARWAELNGTEDVLREVN